MPVFVEDPSQFSKARLKSDLVAHNVALPAGESKKQVYVELHVKHIQHSAADFSSDEEDLATTDDVVAEETKYLESSEMLDPSGLTDDELRAELHKCGVNTGPITATTRALYERRLMKALQADVQPSLNGTAEAALYSDSEEEEVDDAEEGDAQEEDSISEAVQEPDSSLDQSPEKPAESRSQNTGFVQHGCFAHSSRLFPSPDPPCVTPVTPQSFSITNMKETTYYSLSPSPAPYRASPRGGRGWTLRNVQPPEEPVTVDEPVTESADTEATAYSSPPGIIVTRRRPIKGAAGRPVTYKYPDALPLSPVSPTTAERRELERRLVPIWVRMLVFAVVTCLLVLIYAYVNDDGLFVSLLDRLSQGSTEEQLLVSEDTPMTDPISGQE